MTLKNNSIVWRDVILWLLCVAAWHHHIYIYTVISITYASLFNQCKIMKYKGYFDVFSMYGITIVQCIYFTTIKKEKIKCLYLSNGTKYQYGSLTKVFLFTRGLCDDNLLLLKFSEFVILRICIDCGWKNKYMINTDPLSATLYHFDRCDLIVWGKQKGAFEEFEGVTITHLYHTTYIKYNPKGEQGY